MSNLLWTRKRPKPNKAKCCAAQLKTMDWGWRIAVSCFSAIPKPIAPNIPPASASALYLCRQIISAHGGQIGVVNEPGQGTTFWFTLAIAPQ
jgi:nitrogen-specific signal transduction histidine kinase